MEKEYSINADIENERLNLYTFMKTWMINEKYIFIAEWDYKWFINNIVKKGTHLLLDYDYVFKSDDFKEFIVIYYSYLDEDDHKVYCGSIKLIRQKCTFTIPDFKKGE